MILVLTAQRDPSSDLVLRWLHRLDAAALRVNVEQGLPELALGRSATLELRGGRVVDLSTVRACWLRREFPDLPPDPEIPPALWPGLFEEWSAARATLMRRLGALPCLGATRVSETERKLMDLEIAQNLGFSVPDHLVCTRREALLAFLDRHPRVICKPLAEQGTARLGEALLVPGRVRRLSRAEAEALPERLWPTLVQEELERSLDLRIFVLDERMWAVAIPPGPDPDSRTRAAGRRLPFTLSADTQARVASFMAEKGLDTASIDLLRQPDGREVFLEANPAGQFHFVGQTLGLPLERYVAEALLRRAA